MTVLKKISLVFILSFLFISNGCKEEKCGCEGEIVFNLAGEPGIITYNEDSKIATFIPSGVPGSFFTICDPVEKWDLISQYPSGEEDLLVWGRAADDCMQKINPMYRSAYTLHLDSVMINEFSK